MRLYLYLFSAIILICCNEKGKPTGPEIADPGSQSSDYVQGEVAFGLNDTVTLEEIADYIYSLNNISIESIVSFEYLSNLPQDSIQSIKTTFDSKSYIWSATTNVSWQNNESKILVKFWVKEFRALDRVDWQLLRQRFQLNHLPYYFQLGILKVEVGKENEWISILSASNLFRFVELNYITHTF